MVFQGQTYFPVFRLIFKCFLEFLVPILNVGKFSQYKGTTAYHLQEFTVATDI